MFQRWLAEKPHDEPWAPIQRTWLVEVSALNDPPGRIPRQEDKKNASDSNDTIAEGLVSSFELAYFL